MGAARDVDVFGLLDECYYEIEKLIEEGGSIGPSVKKLTRQRIDNWQFGAYGWTSPVNILMTAAWFKWIYPRQDVCKIWSNNKLGKIDGGFSIRNYDETFTVRFVTKFQIYNQFCSPNSGMQGTRALEKSRDHGRIGRDTNLGQRVLFDIELFKNILNDIEDSTPEEARNIFKYFVEKGILIKQRIIKEIENIPSPNLQGSKKIKDVIFSAVYSFKDPQFVRVVVASLIEILIDGVKKFDGCALAGLGGAQTAADARARTPGDLWINNRDGKAFVGCEIKDETKPFGFDVLAAIQDRLDNNKTLQYYLGVTAAHETIKQTDRQDKEWYRFLARYKSQGLSVYFFNLDEFYNYVELFCDIDISIIDSITRILANTRDLKVNTVNNWTELLLKFA